MHQGHAVVQGHGSVCHIISELQKPSLPVATVKGEPVRGGVAGTDFGGRGGGAAKREALCQ